MMADDSWNAPQLTVETLLADDQSAACTGAMIMSKKTGERWEYAYCDVYTFSGGRITTLRSFVTGNEAPKS